MDFKEAETRFRQLQENFRNGAISEESFVTACSQLMVQDASGKYWTIDPKAGDWLCYDGHDWHSAVPPSGDATEKLDKVPSVPKRSGGWVALLLASGLVGSGIIVVIGLLAYRVLSVAAPPEVLILSPSDGAQVSVGEEVSVESQSSDPEGIDRVELWVDDALVIPETNLSSESTVNVTLRWMFQQTGTHSAKVKAYSKTGLVGESATVALNAVSLPEERGPSLVVLEGSAESRMGQEGAWRPTQNGATVRVGETVRTADDGRVQLVFDDRTVAELGGSSELLLEAANLNDSESPAVRLFLQYGDSWHRVEPQEKPLRYEINTPSALVVLNGTLVHVTSVVDGATLIEVLEGDAVAIAAGEERPISAGQNARVEPGEAPLLAEGPAPLSGPDDVPTKTPVCRSDATLSEDVTVPAGAVLQPSQQVEKIWRMRNTGNCAWLDCTWEFISGDRMGGPESVPVPRTEPGGSVDISVLLDVPSRPGAYSGTWRLTDRDGQRIGEAVTVQIRVLAGASPIPSASEEPKPTTTTNSTLGPALSQSE